MKHTVAFTLITAMMAFASTVESRTSGDSPYRIFEVRPKTAKQASKDSSVEKMSRLSSKAGKNSKKTSKSKLKCTDADDQPPLTSQSSMSMSYSTSMSMSYSTSVSMSYSTSMSMSSIISTKASKSKASKGGTISTKAKTAKCVGTSPIPSSVVTSIDDTALILSTAPQIPIDVLQNDFAYPPGQELIVTSITVEPSAGAVALAGDKKAVIYTPPPDYSFTGEVEFEYEACLDDGLGLTCDRANVTVSVNEPPIIARDDTFSVDTNAPGTRVNVLENDITHPTGQGLVVTSITSKPSSGNCELSKDNAAVIYTPSSNSPSVGQIECEYEACLYDGLGLTCDRAKVTISVNGVAIEPTTSSPTTRKPSKTPTPPPTTKAPTGQPSKSPSVEPSSSSRPSFPPSPIPTVTGVPSSQPSSTPSISEVPSAQPSISAQPSGQPSISPTSTKVPTLMPSESPSVTVHPSSIPSESPSISAEPSSQPSRSPTDTGAPSSQPSISPTGYPTISPSTPPPIQRLVCTSDRHWKDDLDRTCKWYKHPNVLQGCDAKQHNTTGWINDDDETPWDACCFCGGGTIEVVSSRSRSERASNDNNSTSSPTGN